MSEYQIPPPYFGHHSCSRPSGPRYDPIRRPRPSIVARASHALRYASHARIAMDPRMLDSIRAQRSATRRASHAWAAMVAKVGGVFGL
jgi:hypothetical protein